MAEEITEKITVVEEETMDLQTSEANNGEAQKRARDEVEEEEVNGKEVENDAKKQKVEEEGEKEVSLGPKKFGSSVEMFNYFFKFVHYWPMNFDINKYEYMILLDLLRKGHPEPDKKIGAGISGFQIRVHPMWKSRCFFIIREDETVDDFSYRKCIDCILPLPEEMRVNSDANKALGGPGGRGGGHGGRGGGGRRGGRGRGRGRGSRN
ncbi:hypothetical protein IFM89_016709 [Coptis chinensis]|uniref:Uncharacterized protein n=1 Tax=Coptis chinensis TaxID=261450 RepID=A0A835ILL3_9MAGN|nr:hypothetical protein IFM89_016709 [Coptis chinensis]